VGAEGSSHGRARAGTNKQQQRRQTFAAAGVGVNDRVSKPAGGTGKGKAGAGKKKAGSKAKSRGGSSRARGAGHDTNPEGAPGGDDGFGDAVDY